MIDELRGGYVSILGDSISTHEDFTNDISANSTIGANPFYYRYMPYDKTYWMRVINALDMKLCVNNSWSGGNLSGEDDPTSGLNRAEELSRNDGTSPRLVIVFMGINDVGRRINPAVFSADYEKTLNKIKGKYPKAEVCCVNLPDRDIAMKSATEVFNGAIDAAVAKAGDNFFVADLFHSRLNNDFYYDNTQDGLHPDEDGMRYIADVIIEAIEKRYASK